MSTDNDKQKNLDRLNNLKSQLISDNVNFSSSLYDTDLSDLPNTFEDIEQPVDYNEVKKDIFNEIDEEITSIIDMYIKDEKLLNSARLKSKKKNYIRKYTRLILVLQLHENNLITIQEGIDVGDKSKEQFDLINKTGSEIAKILNEIDKLLVDCENFFEMYTQNYGIETEEEKIVTETSSNDDSDDNVTVMSMVDLVDVIQNQMTIVKENEK